MSDYDEETKAKLREEAREYVIAQQKRLRETKRALKKQEKHVKRIEKLSKKQTRATEVYYVTESYVLRKRTLHPTKGWQDSHLKDMSSELSVLNFSVRELNEYVAKKYGTPSVYDVFGNRKKK